MSIIFDEQNLDLWLTSHSREVNLTIAVRASLRVFPFLSDEFKNSSIKSEAIGRRIVLPILRALAISFVAIKYKNRIGGLQVAASNAAQIVADVADSISGNAMLSAQSATAAVVASRAL